MNSEYLDSADLEEPTGTPASTWRYWALSAKDRRYRTGRRRVWTGPVLVGSPSKRRPRYDPRPWLCGVTADEGPLAAKDPEPITAPAPSEAVAPRPPTPTSI